MPFDGPRSARATGTPEPLPDGEAAVAAALRWLIGETEAEAVAYLRLSPVGAEWFLLEPRGLPSQEVAEMVRLARHAMLEGSIDEDVNQPMALGRWLGRDGTKILLLLGVTTTDAQEPLRFARYVIELMAARAEGDVSPLERRVREVPGVAWAEMSAGDPPTVRVLFDKDADPEATTREVSRALSQSDVDVEKIDRLGEAEEEPRIRLVDLAVGDDDSSVDVVLDWQGRRLRGRGRGRATESGRLYAAAQAVGDAMKPLLDRDVAVEGVYRSEGADQLDVLVVTVRVGEQRYVGAVASPKGQEDVSGARAVLDALNRRLPQIAGKAGRL